MKNEGMWKFVLALCVLIFPWTLAGTEPQALSPLAAGQALDCPKHVGTRIYQSETAYAGETTASIVGTSRRDASGCQLTAELHLEREGATKSYRLPEAGKQGFSIVDFSADYSSLLLASETWEHKYEFRDVQIAVLPLASNEMHWRNVWDIFGWRDCDASVDPQGFTEDGRIVIQAGPTPMSVPSRRNCVDEDHLYATDLSSAGVIPLPDAARIKRYGETMEGPTRTCKLDPDIIAQCFMVHGRLSAYNGAPSARIWRIGTNRMLGVHDDILPGVLGLKMDWDVEIYGDFYVCPFTRQRPEAMQFVCIESVRNLRFRVQP